MQRVGTRSTPPPPVPFPRVVLVCDEHKEQMDAGLPWLWAPDTSDSFYGTLLMGDDFDAHGLTITGIRWAENSAFIGPERKHVRTLLLERRNGDGTSEEVRLIMTDDSAAQLAYVMLRHNCNQRRHRPFPRRETAWSSGWS
jgi:hypothetical protein